MRLIRLIDTYDYTSAENLPGSLFDGLGANASFAYDWHADDADSFLANDDGDSDGAPIREGLDGPHRFGDAPKSVIGTGSGTVSVWEVDA